MKLQKLIHILIGIVCIGPLPKVQAVSPAPDGGYPGGNTAEGQAALLSLTTGGYNTAVGFLSLRSDTAGAFNTGIGAGTLLANTGDQNTATGAGALLSNTTGSQNTANGTFALFSNTTGLQNAATGVQALFSNTIGFQNTANGALSLFRNTTGNDNTANGDFALLNNTTGGDNTATGVNALLNNTTGNFNTANGREALGSNTDGFENTATGYHALLNNTGSGNTALGYLAGSNLTNGDDNIDIGNDGVAGDAGIIRIGRSFISKTFIAGISGVTASGGAAVFVNSSGQLGTSTSSKRFKDQIKSMDKASEALFGLNPVTFRYKKEIDPQGIPQFGLLAEEVEKVNPDLVVRDAHGVPYTVCYEAVNAMLLNEFLKEHRKVQALEATVAQQRKDFETTITELKKKMESVIARYKEQDARIQKVSDQVELDKPTLRTVSNEH